VTIDIETDVVSLTAALVDIPSVSGDEKPIADDVELALRQLDYLAVERDGNVVLARTDAGRPQRIILAGHLDTVPIADNVPSRRDGDILHGCGSSDMKSGIAVMLRMAALLRPSAGRSTPYDLTYVFYDREEIEAEHNGLGRLARQRVDLLRADLAIVLEPTNGAVEHVREVFAGYEVIATDAAPGALPRLEEPAAAAFVAAIGLAPVAKFGWTDVARFAELGIPAVNFGPGDPDVAHVRDERVDVRVIERVEQTLLGYLVGPPGG
jgi:acetylornithine deacetylase/succinyl-diaminopimelate desuccinylase-like protein